MLVVDASVAFASCLAADGWSVFAAEELVAPPLLRSEACSALHEAMWRREISKEVGDRAIERLAGAPVRLVPLANQRAAWDVAEALGWAKTYDAEYVALARALNCRLVTLDARMRRGAARLVEIIDPADLVGG